MGCTRYQPPDRDHHLDGSGSAANSSWCLLPHTRIMRIKTSKDRHSFSCKRLELRWSLRMQWHGPNGVSALYMEFHTNIYIIYMHVCVYTIIWFLIHALCILLCFLFLCWSCETLWKRRVMMLSWTFEHLWTREFCCKSWTFLYDSMLSSFKHSFKNSPSWPSAVQGAGSPDAVLGEGSQSLWGVESISEP